MGSEVKFVINGDPEGFKRAARESVVEMDKLQKSGEVLAATAEKNTKAADRYVEALKREAIALGVGEEALRRYEMQQLGLSDAAQRQADQIRAAIDGHKQAEEAARRHGDTMEKIGRQIGNAMNAIATAAATAWGVIQKAAIDQVTEFEQTTIKLQATLRATGYAAGKTFGDIEEQVSRLSKVTFFDQEQLREGAAVLARFKVLAGDAFDQALSLAADLAAALGHTVPAEARELGVALQDPERAIRKLVDAGVSLSAAQRAQIRDFIELGQQSKALQVMLDATRGSVGGLAEELNTGMKKSSSDARKAWDDLMETLGKSETVGGSASRLMRSTAGALQDIDDLLSRGLMQQLQRAAGFAMVIAGGAIAMAGNANSGQLIQQSGVNLGSQSYDATESAPRIGRIGPGFATSYSAAAASPFGNADALISASEASIGERGGAAAGLQQAQAASAAEQVLRRLNETLAESIRLATEQGEANKKAATAYDHVKDAAERWVSGLEKEANSIGMTTAEKKLAEAASIALTLATEGERKAFLARAQAAADDLRTEERRVAQKKIETQAEREYEQAMKSHQRELDRSVEGAQRELDALSRSNEEFGKSRVAIEEVTKAKLEETLATTRLIEGADAEVAALEKRLAIQDRIIAAASIGQSMRAEAAQTVGVWNSMAQAGSRLFTDLVMGGRNAFRTLLDEARQFGAEMLSVLGQKLILQIGVAMTGSSALAATASQVGANSVSGAAGNWLASGASTALQYTGVSGAVGSAWTSAQAGYIAQSAYLSGAAESAAVSESIWGTVGSVVAEIPVWGWIAAAVIAVAAMIAGRHKGGPKVAGSSMGQFNAAGEFLGDMPVPGTDNGRIFTPTEMDPDMRRIRNSIGGGFAAMLNRLGGSSGNFGFGIGAENDPNGTAQSRVGGVVTDSTGKVIYRSLREVDDKQVGETLALEAKRMILAALQASDLPAAVANVLKQVDASTATSDTIDDVMKLAEAFGALDDAIAILDGSTTAFQQTLENLHKREDAAQAAWDRVMQNGGTPGEVLAAEQELTSAIMDRYSKEMEMVLGLQRAIDDLKQSAYDFQIAMAQRINNAGGSVDIAGTAWNHAMDLRGQVGGSGQPDRQLRFVNQFVGSLDTWYNTRRSQIERNVAAQQQAAQQAIAAQQSVIQVRIAGLQAELQLTQQWAGIVTQVKGIIDQMKLSGLNPLPAEGRYRLAAEQSATARGKYMDGSGPGRADAASRYVAALQAQLGLLDQTYDRPSPEYQRAYNEIIEQLTKVQDEAQTEAERAVDLQRELVKLQDVANALGQSAVNIGLEGNAELEELNQQYVAQLQWAQAEGERLYNLQITQQQEMLDAVTGGKPVEIFMAERTAEMAQYLRDIRDDGRRVRINGQGTNGDGSSTNPGGTGSPGDDNGNLTQDKSMVTVQFVMDSRVVQEKVIQITDDHFARTATQKRRILADS